MEIQSNECERHFKHMGWSNVRGILILFVIIWCIIVLFITVSVLYCTIHKATSLLLGWEAGWLQSLKKGEHSFLITIKKDSVIHIYITFILKFWTNSPGKIPSAVFLILSLRSHREWYTLLWAVLIKGHHHWHVGLGGCHHFRSNYGNIEKQ